MSSKKKKAAAPAKKVVKAAAPQKPAPAKKATTGKAKDFKSIHSHLFAKKEKHFGIGQDIIPSRDLSRYVKWPKYVRLQRQRAIMTRRLKVPPAINQFSKAIDKNQAATLFKLLSKYRGEHPKEKKARLIKEAAATEPVEKKKKKVIKYGLNHVTELIESKKAKLVVIAHDVDPIELVVWLPALCRKLDIPYCIVKGKARLGALVYHKTASVVALTAVKKEDGSELDQLIGNFKQQFNDNTTENRKWGERELGVKSQHIVDARKKLLAKDLKAKAAATGGA
jgi:large subunit ribosomal protein L7Ae